MLGWYSPAGSQHGLCLGAITSVTRLCLGEPGLSRGSMSHLCPTWVPSFGAKTPRRDLPVMLLWAPPAHSSQECPQCLCPSLPDRGGWAGRCRAQSFHQPVALGCGGSQALLLLSWHLSAPWLPPGTRGWGGGLDSPVPCSPALGKSTGSGWGVHGCSAHPGQGQEGHALSAQPGPRARPQALGRLRWGWDVPCARSPLRKGPSL